MTLQIIDDIVHDCNRVQKRLCDAKPLGTHKFWIMTREPAREILGIDHLEPHCTEGGGNTRAVVYLAAFATLVIAVMASYTSLEATAAHMEFT